LPSSNACWSVVETEGAESRGREDFASLGPPPPEELPVDPPDEPPDEPDDVPPEEPPDELPDK
jgi:hypothetical protein